MLAVGTLTTNVTGHFAFFSEELFLKNIHTAIIFLVYTLFFFAGAFVSGLLVELVAKRRYHLTYVLPVSIEIFILAFWGITYLFFPLDIYGYPIVISYSLLFAMGLQNALVTKISKSVVRTTHLTGLFTDLGIELAQLMTFRPQAEKRKIWRNLQLKLIIVCCFFIGGVIGGFLYMYVRLETLLFPALLLLIALWYDRILFRYYHLKRKFRH